MNKKLRAIFFMICFITAVNTVISAQIKTDDSTDGTQTVEVNADEEKEFYKLTRMIPDVLADGDSKKAKSYAETLLKDAERFRKNWNYGNAVHAANLVLGQIAFDSGDLDEAGRFLLEAGKTPGSPQLNTFGPDMFLAKELLENGEDEVVLKYFELCAKFWKSEDGRLKDWKAAVLKKEMPDFGRAFWLKKKEPKSE